MTTDQAIAAALAILGKTAKIPPPKTNTAKMEADIDKTYKDYMAAVDTLEKKIVAAQAALSSYTFALKQRQEQLDVSNFGLDAKDPAAKQNIAKAQKILHDAYGDLLKSYNTSVKDLDELDKHTMALADYKSP